MHFLLTFRPRLTRYSLNLYSWMLPLTSQWCRARCQWDRQMKSTECWRSYETLKMGWRFCKEHVWAPLTLFKEWWNGSTNNQSQGHWRSHFGNKIWFTLWKKLEGSTSKNEETRSLFAETCKCRKEALVAVQSCLELFRVQIRLEKWRS